MLQLILSGFVGAALALLSQFAIRRWRSATTARAIAVALWEELSAIEILSRTPDGARFDGFTSQTFDTLFSEMALTFPESLFRAVVRYHWKMGLAVKAATDDFGRVNTRARPSLAAKEAMDQRDDLLPRLEAYAVLPPRRLFFRRGEPGRPDA